MAEIVYTIDKQGNVVEEVKGVSGQLCTKVTQKIENSLGKIVDSKKTGDYYKESKAEILSHNRA